MPLAVGSVAPTPTAATTCSLGCRSVPVPPCSIVRNLTASSAAWRLRLVAEMSPRGTRSDCKSSVAILFSACRRVAGVCSPLRHFRRGNRAGPRALRARTHQRPTRLGMIGVRTWSRADAPAFATVFQLDRAKSTGHSDEEQRKPDDDDDRVRQRDMRVEDDPSIPHRALFSPGRGTIRVLVRLATAAASPRRVEAPVDQW